MDPGQSRSPLIAALLLAAPLTTGKALAIPLAPPPPVSPAPAILNAAAVVRELAGITGRETYLLADPAAARSAATRRRVDQPLGNIVEEPGYFALAQVVIGNDTPVTRESLSLEPDVEIAALDGVPGFWVLRAPTIDRAISLCDRLLGIGKVGAAPPAKLVREATIDLERPVKLRGIPNDPDLSKQWHLSNLSNPIADLNAEPAWLAGFTGAGVTVGIVEGGFETTHADLAGNYNAAASQSGGSVDPHGTNVAGVVAAVGNNGYEGAGVAWGARLSKQIFGSTSATAAAIAFRNDLNWVKNNSWGPPDSDMIVKISSVELAAIREAATSGRGGKGTILVWASGNGGVSDRLDYDPFVTSRYVMPISGVGDNDVRSNFTERGSASFLVAPSDGNARGIYTTDVTGSAGSSSGDWTNKFGGSSASAPMAAGAAAVLLEANPKLTWRDVQHVLADSARRCDPTNAGWVQNGAGRWISYDYGLGAIDLGAAVALATHWTPVAPELEISTGTLPVAAAIPDNNATGLSRSVDVGGMLTVETVEAIFNVTSANIGDLEITLISPSGVESLLSAAPRNDTQDNLTDTLFLSRRYWGEQAAGRWTVRIADRKAGNPATWIDWKLNIHGERCRSDIDASGFVDLDDFTLFAEQFELRSSAADINGDGVVDDADFTLFVETFEQGC